MIETENPEINVADMMRHIREEVTGSRAQAPHSQTFPAAVAASAVEEVVTLPPYPDTAVALSRAPECARCVADKPEYAVGELLDFHDEDFVRSAYRAILRREPDAGGFADYLDLLHSERLSKAEILGQMRHSPEGKACAVPVHGLMLHLALHSAYRIPVFGYGLALANFILRLPVIVRNWKRFEATTLRQQREHAAQLNSLASQVEHVVSQVQQELGERDLQLARLISGLASIRPAVDEVNTRIDELEQRKADAGELAAMATRLGEALAQKADAATIQMETSEIRRQMLDQRYNLLDQQRRLALLLKETLKRMPEPISTKQIENMVAEADHLLDAFYDTSLDLAVVLHSTVARPAGYALTSRQLALALEDAHVEVVYEHLHGPETAFPVEEVRSRHSGNHRIEVIKQCSPKMGVPRLAYGQGDAFELVSGQYRIGYTMLETTGIPSEWVRQCNLMDEIWVPSPFNAWTFRRNGVTAPIRVMPLGLIDTNYFHPEIEGHPIEGVFTFLSMFEWGERKAPEALFRAFNQAFRHEEPVVLVCKYTNSDPDISPRQFIESLQLDPQGGRIVFSENDLVPYSQISQLYRSVDCFVLPTRGEGWGMPILEAMACGIPVIASHWSAQQHFMTDANSYPLQVQLVDAVAKCPGYQGFKWADPDAIHLARLLRHVYEHPEEAKQKGAHAAQDVAEKWSLPVTGRRMRERLEAIEKERIGSVRPSPGIAAPPDSLRRRIGIDVSRAINREVTGVGRYTASLLAGLSRLSVEDNPFEYILLPGFDAYVHPEYQRPLEFQFDKDERITLYRGPLPAFADPDHYVPGLDLVYCTGNDRPEAIDTASAMVVYDITFATHPQFHTQENIILCQSNFERAIRTDCHFVAISECTKHNFIAYYKVDPARVSVAYCGVDAGEFYPRTEMDKIRVRLKYGLPKRFFLYVGSLEPRKNLRSAIRAMAEYRGEEVLVVVGAFGWLNSDLHELINRHQDKVRLLGYVPQCDLPPIYSAATATIYPSLYEGFGLPVVESMACGTPVLTSNNSSLAEIATGAALLLEQPTDVKEIGAALVRLAGDRSLYSDLVVKGKERANLFTLTRCALATVDVYRSLIKR